MPVQENKSENNFLFGSVLCLARGAQSYSKAPIVPLIESQDNNLKTFRADLASLHP